jgi:hypothetical protein
MKYFKLNPFWRESTIERAFELHATPCWVYGSSTYQHVVPKCCSNTLGFYTYHLRLILQRRLHPILLAKAKVFRRLVHDSILSLI